tara:strand:- start:44 stop:259 length:216 start_codon:yes stop_codon:yes gene_type:complete
MAIYTILTEAEASNYSEHKSIHHFYAGTDNPKRLMLRFEDSLPSELSSFDSYTQEEVQAILADASVNWMIR